MFYLQELFDDFAYGEVANMAIGNPAVGTIDSSQYRKIVNLINSGLLAIYTRLVLRKKEFNLYQRTDKDIYYIRPDNVGNVNSGDPDVYIEPVDDSLDSDIIKLIEAYDSLGNMIHIDNAKYPDDIFMPEFDIIKILARDPLETLSIVYQAAYPRITIGNDFDPKAYSLYFPRYLKKALLFHVASQFFTGKASQATEGQPSITNTFLYRYENEMILLVNKSLTQETDQEPKHFENYGWV